MIEQEKIYNKKGKLATLKEQRQAKRVGLDVIAKGIVVAFDPMDNDCVYVDTVDVVRLKILSGDFVRGRATLDIYNKQIAEIETELHKMGEAIES